ncbi:DUF3084 domain-containing protein [Synechococcales cyanobacterium C]|uniref:DUF3084 domain-containing protein n=1 Tax=Petrachloros mirabilis ULC683 TaxID=2781853 RepID=A0A8K1ZZZ3_9CYAN|nr:DUF3084 domain-containing protein [Petrachloros mirabilis]NCJ06917.1 DUF3084 domain-containing protein [Petrachloros mirabilis ULC683]
MTGYILILAIIFLGGAIATLGDRIGTRVGKARLSLFNLRPKNTAVLVTILTGSLISTSTIGILLATNRELQDALLRFDEIRQQSEQATEELNLALDEKAAVEDELALSRAELTEAVRRLRRVNESLTNAIARERESETQLRILQRRFQEAQANLSASVAQAQELRSEIQRLSTEEQQLRTEQQRLVAQRDQAQARLQQAERQTQSLEASVRQAQVQLQQVEGQKQQLETQIAAATQKLAAAEAQQRQLSEAVAATQAQLTEANTQRQTLLSQRASLEQEVAALEENRRVLEQGIGALALGLRQGNIAIRSREILASDIISGTSDRATALQFVETLLRQARSTAMRQANLQQLPPEQQVVQMTSSNVDNLVSQITDGHPYVVRILSAANFLVGEQSIIVVPEIAPNLTVFRRGEVISSITLNPSELTDEQLIDSLNRLFSAASNHAVASGVLPNPVTRTVGSFSQIDVFRFLLALKEQRPLGTIQIEAVVSDQVYTAGPLTLELVARKDQQVILRSG